LDEQMTEANRVWPDLQDEVWIKDGTVHLARLEARELPTGVARLEERLTNLFARLSIAQLLLEVNHWVGIDPLLTNLNPQEHPTENLTAKKLAVIMAEGLNIGLQNMSYCVPSMSYADLAGVYDRYIREDTLRQALVTVVNFYHRLPITRYWGQGTASSSGSLGITGGGPIYSGIGPPPVIPKEPKVGQRYRKGQLFEQVPTSSLKEGT
jgi:hypothetical protein